MNNTSPVSDRLRNLLADVFDVSPEQVTPELAVGNIERWDSFGHLQAILAIEVEYGLQFPAEKIPELTSVARLQAELRAKGAEA